MAPRRLTTVITAAADQDLTTVVAVKLALGLTASTHDTYLGAAITAASAEIARYCNRVFLSETVEDTIYVDRSVDHLVLSRSPIVSVTSVVEDDVTLTTDDYTLDKPAGMLLRLNTDADLAQWPVSKTVVRYVAGYATVPADLDKAAQRVVAHAYMARQRDPALRSVSIPGVYDAQYWVDADKRTSFPSDAQDIIDNYRLFAL